jgi:replicative DNA helicase
MQQTTAVKRRKASYLPARVTQDTQGKLPPQDTAIEEAVLGAILLEKNALTEVISFLRPHHFYDIRHEAIYQVILELFAKSEPVDMRTVVHGLRKAGKLETVGNAIYIAELTSKVSSAANVSFHARYIVELSIKRGLIQIAGSIQREAFEDTSDVFELLDRTESFIYRLVDDNTKGQVVKLPGLIGQAFENMRMRQNNESHLTGVPSGFTRLDRVTDGWQKSDLIIVAARPGMGKTAFIVSAMRNAAVDFNVPVAIFSLEMASIQLVNRLISSESGIESEVIKTGKIKEDQWARLISSTNKLSQAPIFIDDTPAIGILELRAKCRRLKAQHNVGLIVVDYLQLMKGEDSGNREQEIASISRALKGIAKELDVPVIALSQLSRGVETRGGDKRPQLSDLRESGSIEQDADIVIFLYRAEYYKIPLDDKGNPTNGMAEVIIAKHRNGSLENVKLKFIGSCTKFEDWNGDDLQFGRIGGEVADFNSPV